MRAGGRRAPWQIVECAASAVQQSIQAQGSERNASTLSGTPYESRENFHHENHEERQL